MPGEFDKLDAYARWFYGREKNSFVFSLIRDGALKFKQYETHLFFIEEEGGFGLSRNNQDGYLYKFGWDIHLKRIGDNTYHCHVFYEYNDEENPLIDTAHSNNFEAKRNIVIGIN